jgi:head-tail adaptor
MVVAANQGQKTVKWENCEKIWPLARDKSALAEYTDKNIRTYLAMLNKS